MEIASELATVNAELWAFVPPVVAIIAVFILQDVIASLLIGVIAGAVIYAASLHAGVVGFLQLFFAAIFDSAGQNIPLITFMLVLGAIVSVITLTGGHFAYGRLIEKKMKTVRGVSLATVALGILVFIDDYFSCLLVGAVMGPTADRYKMSREKLAYFIDSTAAPICILAPVSSWAMTITHTVESAGIENGLMTFIRSAPYNFYAIFALLFVFYTAIFRKDFSYMRRCEAKSADASHADVEQENPVRQKERRELWHENKRQECGKNGNVLDLILPNITVIILILLSIAALGGFFGPEKISLMEAYTRADTALAINFGCFGAFVVCFLLYVPRKLLSVGRFFEGAVEGMKSMFTAVLILVLAWSLSTITTTFLGAETFVELLMADSQGSINLALLPAVIFIFSAVVAFGLGSWGTFLVTIPFIAIIARATDISMFHLFLAATLAGSVLGDHASPITDTTILSSVSARCNHISHVKSQLPYALLVCFGSVGAFLVSGFLWQSGGKSKPVLIICYGVGLALMAVVLLAIYRIPQHSRKKEEKHTN
ncbi:MAG: tetracycline efflux Na+/H+ antiporter family transporter Tet(35) [Treponemataceae bacterium]|nr:MAG: tetracycline efflux Na+/H+ antiporter family transporter Tet(35) [Treponemataceae bacterium]